MLQLNFLPHNPPRRMLCVGFTPAPRRTHPPVSTSTHSKPRYTMVQLSVPAHLVQHFRLLARVAPHAHGIVHDNDAEAQARGKER